MSTLDETHDPKRNSWVASAEDHPDFPIQNLPLGVFSPPNGEPRGGVAIGDAILDIRAAAAAGQFSGAAQLAANAASGPTLNPLMALGNVPRIALRKRLSELLSADGSERKIVEGLSSRLLHNAADCAVHLPAAIGNYTDFFAGIHHAVNASRMFGMGLAPNYKHFPIAYHGRASSVRPQERQLGGQTDSMSLRPANRRASALVKSSIMNSSSAPGSGPAMSWESRCLFRARRIIFLASAY